MKPENYSAITSILVPMGLIAAWIIGSMVWPPRKRRAVRSNAPKCAGNSGGDRCGGK